MANNWTGTPGRFERTKRFDPQREQAFNQALQMGLSGLQAGQAGFAPIAERETRRFREETLPSIAQRLTSMGAQSTGSGRQEAFYRGGTELGTNLAALGSQYDLQRQNQLMQLLGMGLTPQEDERYFPQQHGMLGVAGSGLLQGLGAQIQPALAGLGGGGGILQWLMSLLGGGGQAQPQQQQQIAPGSVVYDQPSPSYDISGRY